MKIRIGFVSNSSSTSFCMYGVILERDEIDKFCRQLNIEESSNGYDIEDLCNYLGLSNHQAYQDSDSYVIGESWDSIEDDQTGGDFKKEIQDKISTLDGKLRCSFHEGGWYDG